MVLPMPCHMCCLLYSPSRLYASCAFVFRRLSVSFSFCLTPRAFSLTCHSSFCSFASSVEAPPPPHPLPPPHLHPSCTPLGNRPTNPLAASRGSPPETSL